MGSRSKGAKDYCFAPIPFRALCDCRLFFADFLVLCVISAHDRGSQIFSRSNGQGCWVGRVRLSFLTGLSGQSVSRSITRLIEFGYLIRRQNSKDRRRHIYYVIYNEHDVHLLGGKSNPTKNVSLRAHKYRKLGVVDGTQSEDIGHKKNREAFETSDGFVSNKSYETLIDSNESNRRFRRKNRFRKIDAQSSNDQPIRSVASLACEIEKSWKGGRISSDEALESLVKLADTSCDATEQAHIERILAKIEN